MSGLKEILMTVLRDKNTPCAEFRKAAHNLSHGLAHEVENYLETEPITLETPIAPTQGTKLISNIVLVPILRSGIIMVAPFLEYFPRASIGVMGIRRDEQTAEPQLYYDKIPEIKPKDKVIILDPMLATGGTLVTTLDILKQRGARQGDIIFVGIVCAPEGLEYAKKSYPKVTYLIVAHDERLNDKKFIVPGLGDFGDRYFGVE